MQSQTNQFVTQQAALSTQVASAVTAVNSQLETAARDAASASVAANEAAESAAVAANEAATAANAERSAMHTRWQRLQDGVGGAGAAPAEMPPSVEGSGLGGGGQGGNCAQTRRVNAP